MRLYFEPIFRQVKVTIFKKLWRCDFFEKHAGRPKKLPSYLNPRLKRGKIDFLGSFDKQICWKRVRRARGDHQHLWRLSNTIYHFYQGFLWSKCSRFLIGMYILSHSFSLFHGLFERFLAFFLPYFFDYLFAYFFAICFYYFSIDFHAPKNEKQSQCKWGF